MKIRILIHRRRATAMALLRRGLVEQVRIQGSKTHIDLRTYDSSSGYTLGMIPFELMRAERRVKIITPDHTTPSFIDNGQVIMVLNGKA